MKNIKRTISVLFIIILLVCGLNFFISVTKRPDSDFKYIPFFEEKQDFDVLFFGTSHVINGIYPMQLWNDYGIVSYNFGGHANSIGASYWVYKNAVEYHKPKVVVLDVLGVGNVSNEMTMGNAHLSFDAFPLTRTKITGIRDIFGKKSEQMELIFPFSVYHNRWNEIRPETIKAFFKPTVYSKEKGAELRLGVAVPDNITKIEKYEYNDESTISHQYINRLVKDCRAEGIEVLLINIPYPASVEAQRSANSVYKLAEELEIPYINMQYEDIVDFDIDCCDADSHLNPSGARKVTDYLGIYLKEHYQLSDHRKDINYQSWNKDYEEYRQFLFQTMRRMSSLKPSLALLNNSNYTANLTIPASYEFDSIEEKLVAQLGSNLHIERRTENDDWDARLVITDKLTDKIIVEKRYKINLNPIS